MIEETAIKLISTVGFPIFVALWFMIRTEKVIGNNTKMMEKMINIVSDCDKK